MIPARKIKPVLISATAVLGLLVLVFLAADGSFGRRYQGKTARNWARQLFSENPTNQAAARATLIKMGRDAVPELIHLLHTRDWRGRETLRSLAARSPRSLQNFILVRIGPSNVGVIRAEAARMLGEIGPEAALAVPDLVRALENPDRGVVSQAAWALGRIGAAAVPSLIPLAQSSNLVERHMAVYALGEIGAGATGALSVLMERLDDPNPDVRSSANYSLGMVGKTALPQLMALVASDDTNTARLAVATTTNYPVLLRAMVPHLIEMIESGNAAEKAQAQKILRRLNPQNPTLLDLLNR